MIQAFFWFPPLWGTPCNGIAEGYIYDAQTKSPLTGVNIYIEELGIGVVPDENGKYFIKELCEGSYTFRFSMIGYKSHSLTVQIGLQPLLLSSISLEPEEIMLESVEIRTLDNQPEVQTQNTLNELQLSRSAGKSLGESLKDITGVNVLQTGPSIAKPVIHGLHSNRILILNNGVRQEGQQWGSEHAPEIDPFIATRLTVVKGAAAVRYGADAIGGVILVNPAQLPENPRLAGQINAVGMYNGRQAIISAQLEGGIPSLKGFSWRLQGTYKRTGNMEAANYYLSNTGVQELNFSVNTGYVHKKMGMEVFYSLFSTELGIFKGSQIGNLTDLQAAIQSPIPYVISGFNYDIENPRQKIVHQLLKLSSYYQFSEHLHLHLQYGMQLNSRREFDLRRGGRSDIPALDLSLSSNTIDLILEHRLSPLITGSTGINASLIDNENIPGTGIRPLIPNYRSLGIGIFLIEKYTRERFELEAGIRYDYKFLNAFRLDANNNLLKPEYEFNNFSASLGVLFRFNSWFSYSGNLGSAWRPPAMNELFSEGLHHGVAAIEIGNDRLKSEQAYKWINTFRIMTKKTDIELSAYYNLIRNYIFLKPSLPPVLTIRGAYPVFNYDQTDAVFYGLDLALKYTFIPHLAVHSKISIVRAKDVINQLYLPFIPSDRYEVGLTWQSEAWKKFRQLYISANCLQTMKQIRVEENSDYAPSPEAYALMNLEGGMGIPIGKNLFSFSIQVSNLFNTAYREYMNRFRYYADDIGRNLVLRTKFIF